MWYSHKFKWPELRYEVKICIVTGYIVLIIGGYPCGAYPDLQIFREALSEILEVGEKVIADGRYKGENIFKRRGILRRLLLWM